MSRDKVHWSLSDEAATRFAPRVTAPQGGDQGKSMVLSNRKGEVLLIWLEDQQLKWAIYNKDGKLVGKKGAGPVPGNNKPTAFVGPDDVFYIVF
jgi:hypothetical protein